MSEKVMSGSELFRQYVGDRSLLTNPTTHAIFRLLVDYEQHHHREHEDCEREKRGRIVLAIRAAGFLPTLAEALASEKAEEWLQRMLDD